MEKFNLITDIKILILTFFVSKILTRETNETHFLENICFQTTHTFFPKKINEKLKRI